LSLSGKSPTSSKAISQNSSQNGVNYYIQTCGAGFSLDFDARFAHQTAVITVLASQRKTALIFSLVFALATALAALIFQESMQERLGTTFYIAGLSILGCILLVLAGYVWDRALFQRLRDIGVQVSHSSEALAESKNDRDGTAYEEDIGLARQIERMAQSLQKAEPSYRAIVQDQVDLICRYDAGGKLTFVNEAYARFFGRGRHDFIGHDFPPHALGYPGLLSPATSSESNSFEMELEGIEGRKTAFHWTCRTIVETNRDRPEYQAVGHDITARKESESTLLRSKLAAETASRAKGEFLAVVSHELRTPINGMLGFARLLQGSSLDPSQQEHVEMIVSAGRMMERLVGDILDLSRIEAGHIQLDHELFDVRECVDNVVAFFAPKAHSSGLTLNVSIHPNVPRAIVGDCNRLRQILINLVGNALKFTERGSVRLDVERASLDGEDTDTRAPVQLAFSIVDTGIGIPSEKIPRLFLPFSQVDASARVRGGGTGLGLVISKRLCEIMGGTISVQSRPGEGSTFRFTLKAESEPTDCPRDVPLRLEPATA